MLGEESDGAEDGADEHTDGIECRDDHREPHAGGARDERLDSVGRETFCKGKHDTRDPADDHGGDTALGHGADAAREHLRGYGWPGNVRELKHSMLKACLECCDNLIEPAYTQTT